MRRLCALGPADATIFDLYAGSGTTGEAVMQLNAAGEGRRRFVLCQSSEAFGSSERSIAELTHQRLSSASVMHSADGSARGEEASGQGELDFRTLRLDDR